MVKIWEREGFSALVDAIKVNREEQKKVTNYTSTFMSTANKNNVTKPPALPQKTFDWQSIIKKAQEKKVDPRSDDRKQAQLANQEIAAHQAQTQRNIEAESGRWTKAYEQSKIKEAEEDMLASTMSFDAELKPGDKLYLDWESNTVTNKPTNMELYKVEDTYVPIYRNAAGQLSFPEGMPVVDLSKVKDAKYTPDIEIYLRGEVDKFDTTRPQTLAPEIVPNNQQLYFDRVLNQVVDYETQTPLYWDQFTGQMTEQETENPVAANEETLTYLGENFKSYQDTYASFEALGQLGMPADPNAVGITPQVTRENVLEGSKIWTMTTGEAEQNTVYPDPTTNQPMLLERQNPAFQLSSFLANIPWFNGKTIGDTLGGKTAGLLNAGINWIMTGGNLPKQYTFGQQSTFMNKPILGISPITAMSYVAAGVTLGWNSVMSLFRQVGYTFSGQMTYKENVENSFDNFYKKIEIARRNAQLDKIEMAYNSGRTMQEIIGEAANQNIEYRTQLNNLQEGRAENLNPMQIAALTDDLESKVIKQQSYIDLLLQLQRETVGKSQVQFDYANKLIDSGHPNLGAASMASGLESFYAGADFNLMRQYLNSSPTQRANFVIPAGQEVFFAGIEGMSAKELTEFENFVRHNELGFDLYPEAYISGETFKFYEGGDKVINLQKPATGKDFSQMWMGANRLFLYDVAEQVTKTGVEMTPVEMLDYLKETWLPNFFASAEENPGHNRYIEKEIELTQQFSDLSFSQMSISNMYLEAAAGFTTGSPEHAAFMQLSNNFREEAFYNYIENVIPHHIRSGILNPYAAWSYGMDSELDAKFKKAIATASFQLGRLLSEPEITQLSYMYQDPAMELFGEVFLDLNNFILPAVGGITKSAGKNIVVPAVKKIPGVAKALDGLANAGFVKLFTGQSLQTVATKQGQSATDLLLVVLQTKPATKEEFIKQVSDIATFAKKVTTITDNITEEVAKLADSTVFKGNVPPRIQKEILDLARTIDPDEWIKLADNAWDKVKLGYTESFTKQVLKENPGKSMADDVVRNAINHKVEQRMGNFFGAERLASTIAENFRETSLKQNMTKLGSKLVMNDSISGAIAKKYGDTALGRMLGGLLELQSKYMRMWVWATLARRPAWMIFNFTDNMFRYVMSSLFEGSRFIDDMKGIGDMLSKEGVPEYIMETGIVPPKKAQASFFSDVFQGTSEVEKLALENVNLSANPFSFATHWLNLYRHNAVGRGFFGKIWGGFQAWPMGIRSLNNAIETGMKTRMYLKFYERNIAKLNHTAVDRHIGYTSQDTRREGCFT